MVHAVRDVSFDVRRGEIFGFLGPNGAGKTTTLKTLLGLIFPTRGTVRLFGQPVTARAVRRRLGYLPENPYLYQYLTARELMDLFGRLAGLDAETRARRGPELLERVGLSTAMDRPVRKYSKGMLQRAGLAQALLGDPDLLILDEPMTGLDPIGRKEVRDLILEERRRGRTVLFSSHILSDVELLCDRVAILKGGELAAYGSLDSLLQRGTRITEVELGDVNDALRGALGALDVRLSPLREHLSVTITGEDLTRDVLRLALDHGARVLGVTPRRESLEDLFLREGLDRRIAPGG
ncbi:MAG: ABC transporter ATP-binding protein [Deltaproteobacteria bacterium]|nr:ABC transporter ATP-binding protein [Deltaproteobacteria bacterium]